MVRNEWFLKVLINLRSSLSPFISPQIFCLAYFLPLPIVCAYFKWKYIASSMGVRPFSLFFLKHAHSFKEQSRIRARLIPIDRVQSISYC